MQGHHWAPEDGTCRPLHVEGFTEDAGPDPLTEFRGPTLLIWWSPQCVSCTLSATFFDRLQQAAAAAGYDVRRVQVTGDRVRRYPHVRSVPRYDIVLPRRATESFPSVHQDVYGEETQTHSVSNADRDRLREWFPQLRDQAEG